MLDYLKFKRTQSTDEILRVFSIVYDKFQSISDMLSIDEKVSIYKEICDLIQIGLSQKDFLSKVEERIQILETEQETK